MENVLAKLHGIRCGSKLHLLHNYWLKPAVNLVIVNTEVWEIGTLLLRVHSTFGAHRSWTNCTGKE